MHLLNIHYLRSASMGLLHNLVWRFCALFCLPRIKWNVLQLPHGTKWSGNSWSKNFTHTNEKTWPLFFVWSSRVHYVVVQCGVRIHCHKISMSLSYNNIVISRHTVLCQIMNNTKNVWYRSPSFPTFFRSDSVPASGRFEGEATAQLGGNGCIFCRQQDNKP